VKVDAERDHAGASGALGSVEAEAGQKQERRHHREGREEEVAAAREGEEREVKEDVSLGPVEESARKRVSVPAEGVDRPDGGSESDGVRSAQVLQRRAHGPLDAP